MFFYFIGGLRKACMSSGSKNHYELDSINFEHNQRLT